MERSEIEAIVHEVLRRTMNRQDTVVQGTMPLALAVKLIEKIEAKAAEWNMRVVTAVSDASGNPVAVHFMEGAHIRNLVGGFYKTYKSIAF